MKPEQVTDEMIDSYCVARLKCDGDPLEESASGIAAALTAMPDDLLREIVRERGCVMVPAEPTQAMIAAMRTGSRKDWPSDELCRVRYAALLAAAETPEKGADHE